MPAYGVYRLILEIVGRDRTGGIFSRVASSLGTIAQYATAIIGAQLLMRIAEGIRDMAYAAVEAVAFFQNMQISLSSLVARELVQLSEGTRTVAEVWSEAEVIGAQFADRLADIAILSPYTVESTQNAYRMAVAFGFSTEEGITFTEAILRQAAGIGANNSMLDRMAYNLAQIRLQNKVTKLDIRQLALAGFDLLGVLRYVGEQMGENIETHLDFNAAIEAGTITWEDFTKYFDQYTRENFEGATERMARSLYGLQSTFHDVFVLTLPQVFLPAAERVTDFLNKILDSFIALRESGILEEWAVIVEKKVDKIVTVLEGLLGYIEGVETPWQKFELFLKAILPEDQVQEVYYRVMRLFTYIGLLKKQLTKDLSFINRFFEDAKTEFNDLWEEYGAPVMEFVREFAANMLEIVKAYAVFGSGSDELKLAIIDTFGAKNIALVMQFSRRVGEVVKNTERWLEDLGKKLDIYSEDIEGYVEDAITAIEGLIQFFKDLDWESITGNLSNVGENILAAIGEIDFSGIIGNLFQGMGEGGDMDMGAMIEQFFQALSDWSDTLPEKASILNQVLLEFSDMLGTQLLPNLYDLGMWALQHAPTILAVTSAIGITWQIMSTAATILGPILFSLGMAFGGLSGIMSAVGTAAGFVASVVSALAVPLAIVGALVGIFALAWITNFGGIQQQVVTFATMVKDHFTAMGQIIGPYITPIIQFMAQAWQTLSPILGVIVGVVSTLIEFWGALASVLLAIVMKAVQFITAIILKAGQVIFDWFIGPLQILWDLITTMFPEIETIVTDVVGAIVDAFRGWKDMVDSVIQWLRDLAATIMSIKIPEWAQRSSPSPIEQTFMGWSEQLQNVAKRDIPMLGRALNNLSGPDMSFATPGAGGYIPYGGASPQESQRPIEVTINVAEVQQNTDWNLVAENVARIISRRR